MKKQTPIISGTLGALTGNLSILGVLIVCFALFDATIFQGLISFLGLNTSQQLITAGGINVQQSELIKLILGTMGVNLIGRIILFGPIFGAICVYIGRNHTEKKNSSLYGGINFALSRYKLLFVPNLLAQLAIQIGMIIIIPGVLSWMQFAFVEPVACLEEEKHVLSRSKRLTKGEKHLSHYSSLDLRLLSGLRHWWVCATWALVQPLRHAWSAETQWFACGWPSLSPTTEWPS